MAELKEQVKGSERVISEGPASPSHPRLDA